jgi:hypothetical protein
MVTLNDIYFECIKIVRKIFAKYIVPILQVYPNILLYFFKWLKIKFITITIIFIFIFIACNKILNFNIIFN